MLCSERLRNAMNKRPVSVGQVCTNSWIQEILFYKKKSSNFSGIRSAADFNGVNPGRPTNGHPWRNSPEVILFHLSKTGERPNWSRAKMTTNFLFLLELCVFSNKFCFTQGPSRVGKARQFGWQAIHFFSFTKIS